MNTLQQRGFTLVEVLIAVLVMAIGLLGLAGLQLTSLQSNQSAYHRSVATMAAMEIADRMIANGGQVASYAIDIDTAPPSASNCVGGTCDPSAMADFDLALWKCSLGKHNEDATCQALGVSGELPSGDGRIVDDGGNQFTITIMWDDERTGATGTACSDDTDVDLTCFTMTFMPRSG
jgi:type IV pilus assembly protein PilV